MKVSEVPHATYLAAALVVLHWQATAAITLGTRNTVGQHFGEASWLSLLSRAGAHDDSRRAIFGIPASTLVCFGVGCLGAAIGTLIAYFAAKKYSERGKGGEADAAQDDAKQSLTQEQIVPTTPAQHQITPEECEQLAMKIMQRLAQKVGPQLAKGQAVRSILEARVEAMPNTAKNFVLAELNSICGTLFEAVDAEEAMLLLNWNETAEFALPSPTTMVAGLFSPAMLAMMFYVELAQISIAQAPICAICIWAIIIDWRAMCSGIPMLKAWVWFELFAASLLIMSRAMLVLKIRAGRRELRDNQKELEQKLVKGISAERADEDLREMCVAYTILLRKALLVETDVRESAWQRIAGAGTIFWILCALWNYVIVFGWTFVPGVVAFHLSSKDAAGGAYCGAWASVVASRLTSLLSVLFLSLDLIALAVFTSERIRHYPAFAEMLHASAAKFDKKYMQGVPFAQTFVKAFVLRASTEASKAKLAVSVYERKSLMKQRDKLANELKGLDVAINKLEESESALKEKAYATDKEEMEAEAEKLEKCILNPDLLKSKGHDLAEKATHIAAALEQGTTEDLERMMQRIMDAVNAGMESEAFKKAKATAAHAAEEGVQRATEIAHVAERKIREAHLEEMVETAKEQAQAAQDAATASIKSAAETISSKTGSAGPSKEP
mmetsp:Transcript_52897/g.123816  ORF Transcript_52897/g.123816 Transcript_52897/m.123816 type:complete len:669 (-) Transcript_52897:117-2123(-)